MTLDVPLNHFYAVIDSETYAAIEQSDFLRREFSANEQRTTVRTDRTYTGLYFYGENTYFEFFDEAKEKRRRVGDTGIAFGLDYEGIEGLRARLAAEFSIEEAAVTREFQGTQVPWFASLWPAGFGFESSFAVWVMQYLPGFLAEWHPQASPDRGVTRAAVLRRYKAVLKETPAQAYFDDVTGLTIAAGGATIEALTTICRLFGYGVKAEGEATVLKGPGVSLRLVAETSDARGVREVLMRVNRSPEARALRFGARSTLTFSGDGTARWVF